MADPARPVPPAGGANGASAQESDPTPDTRGRWYTALGTGALFAGALAYVGAVDPHRPGAILPGCPFRMLTGWNCPACGGLRMTHDLLHGDLAAAVTDNVFLLIGIPLLAAAVILIRRSGRTAWPLPAVVTVVVLTTVWTVVRNLPGFPLVPTVLTG